MTKTNSLIRICLAIPSLEVGGMERVMSEIAWDFSKRENVELHLLLFGRTRAIFYDIPKTIVIHKPSFEYVDSKRTITTFKTIQYIRKEIKAIAPSVILSFGEIWNNLVLLSLYGLKYPVFVSDRCQPDKSFGKVQDWLRRKLYPKAKGVIAQTEKAKEIYKKQFAHDNIAVIGNPIRSIVDDKTQHKENVVVSVGRLIDTKNYDQLINIFASLNKQDWKLIIIGGDANKQKNSLALQQQIDCLGQNENIILAGTQKDVESYLLKSKIFAFTSSSEGFPNVIGEAMSVGLPIVAYDCVAGPSDMITDGVDGFLIPVFDMEKFSEKLKYLMENDDIAEQMGIMAKNNVKRFSVESICQLYYDFLNQ